MSYGIPNNPSMPLDFWLKGLKTKEKKVKPDREIFCWYRENILRYDGDTQMRPIERLVGRPVGAIEVRFGVDDVGAAYGMVECYNALTKKTSFLKVDGVKAAWIDVWLKAGKPGNIQDALPQLTADEREQLISGITPEEWKEMFA